jgi:uncharacterized membrane protein YbaN (DUF454 family)
MYKLTKKTLYLVLGFISLILGFFGLILPVLPTTPFIILAAFLFNKSSPKVHSWLTSIPIMGSVIIEWEKEKIVRVKTKVIALTMLWSLMLWTLIFGEISLSIKLVIVFCGIGISIYLLSFPSSTKIPK